MSLPPIPGLIPISSLSLNNVKNNIRAVEKEVMGEQRSLRIKPEASNDLIDNAPSTQAPRTGITRRKSQRKHKQVTDNNKVNARVNPIFVWVRQENNKIVDVKCEDYDKRNRIVLTKTPHGWRAMPRTETLAPNLKAAVVSDEPLRENQKARKSKKAHHHRHHHKVKRKSTAVQVDCELPALESQSQPEPAVIIEHIEPPFLIVPKGDNTPDPVHEDVQKKEVSSALDNLLAVAELEFNQQIQEEAKNVDRLPETTQVPEEIKSESQIGIGDDCDDSEDDDLVMNQLLMHLEQSLQSPESVSTKHAENTEPPVIMVESGEENDQEIEVQQDENADEEEYADEHDNDNIDEQPTDLSIPKVVESRPSSRCSIIIQSPQPSGLPPVPPSPDLYKTEHKLPESDESISSSLPDKKCRNDEDVTLRAMLSKDTDKNNFKSTSTEPSRLLELLMSPESESPLAQLKRLLTDSNISMPDPLLIPKNRLSAILTSPGNEIPRLLHQRPELRLPEALKHADLLKNPDILVITVHQLKTILQKQSIIPGEKSPPKTQETPIEAHTLCSLLNPTTATTALMSWLPYLQQLEMAAMTFGNQDFLKMLKANPNNFGPFPPSFPITHPQLMPQVPPAFQHFYPHHNQFEYPIYQQFIPPNKNHCCATEKTRAAPKFAPYFNPQHMRSNLQVPQYNPVHHRNQKQQKSKVQSHSHSNKNVYRDKCSENVIQAHPLNQSQQPMDLSGVSPNVMLNRSKYNKRLNYCDPQVGAKPNVRCDDTVPEVGSTTASIEDFSTLGMQEMPKNVWNPLFTKNNNRDIREEKVAEYNFINQTLGPASRAKATSADEVTNTKGTSIPNNWIWPTSVTATGE